MKFKFRYESILSYRGHLREKAALELSRAQHNLRKAVEVMDEYYNSRETADNELKEGLKKKIPSQLLLSYSDYIDTLDLKIAKQMYEIASLKKTMAEKFKNLQEKTKQYKIIEKLKEKDLEQWNQEQHLLEQKTINETAVLRHGKGALQNPIF